MIGSVELEIIPLLNEDGVHGAHVVCPEFLGSIKFQKQLKN